MTNVTTAVMEYICKKAVEAKMRNPPCDLQCATKGIEKAHKPRKVKENDFECDLRCAQKVVEKKFPEFVGPVHYSMLCPPDELYRDTMIETSLINLLYFLLGATVMMILFHTLSYKQFWPVNLHILLTTIGTQIFMPVAFQLLHPLDGAAIWMRWGDRQKESWILRLVAIVCIWFSTLFLMCYGEYQVITFHSFFGFLCAIFCIADLAALLLLYRMEEYLICRFERVICIPSFLFSTIAFISGLFRSSMMRWYPSPRYQIPIFLMLFCIIYTFLVVYRPIKCFVDSRAWRI